MPRVRVLFVIVALVLGSAAAQVCTAELRAALPGPDATPGQVAAVLLARAVQLIEPAYPPTRDGRGPLEGAGPAADSVTYLFQRRLLPSRWTPGDLSTQAWADMLARFAGGYRVTPPEVAGGDRATMLDEAARTLELVADAVRPLPVFAVDADGHVTLFVVIWNWTPVPRQIVLRPPDGLQLGEGAGSEEAARPVLEAMSGCALRFETFVYAREDQALRLFVAQGESTLNVVAAEPQRAGIPGIFGTDEVVDVLTFRSPAVDGVRAMSLSIEGPSPGFGAVLGLLLHVRTNVGLTGALRSLTLP